MALINQYKPRLSTPRSWDDLEDSFNRWFGQQYKSTIAELIRHIQKNGLDKRIYGLSSMDKLVISIYNPIEWHREALHVTFDITSQNWHFVYYSMPFQSPEFVRTYAMENGMEKFDQFIQMINW
jgi:hypothetical protein